MIGSTKEGPTESGTTRLEAFSDGVFAIAITLLIIEVKVPSHETLNNQTLMQYIWHQWPKYFAYILTFLNIGIYWANHHYLFKLFKSTDHVFNLLNVFFLMAIAFLPYPTGILGEYSMEVEHARSAIIFFSFAMCLPAIGYFMMWTYARREKHIIDQRLRPAFIKKLNGLYLLSNLLYIAAFIISLFSPITGLGISVILTLVYLLPPRQPEYKEQ
jgi:uncharacterized membrane protein